MMRLVMYRRKGAHSLLAHAKALGEEGRSCWLAGSGLLRLLTSVEGCRLICFVLTELACACSRARADLDSLNSLRAALPCFSALLPRGALG